MGIFWTVVLAVVCYLIGSINSSILISTPDLKKDENYTISLGGTTSDSNKNGLYIGSVNNPYFMLYKLIDKDVETLEFH